jgi:2-hydroxy-3-oxopropionate reductase
MQNMRIGFIGLGTMGSGMAKNLLKAGFFLTAYDVRTEQCDEVGKLGAKVGGSAKEVGAASDVVITMVFDDNQTEEVIYGSEGILEGLKKGTIIVMSNVSPGLIQRLASNLEGTINILGAPVSGGYIGADTATLAIMVGGNREVFERCRVLFDAMGKNIFYCGKSHAGIVAKLTNNIILEGTIALVLESMALGSKVGLDPSLLLNVYKASTGSNWVIDHWDFVTEMRTTKLSTLLSLRKDIDLALSFAEEEGIELPITSVTHNIDLKG